MLLSIDANTYPVHFNETAYRALNALLTSVSYTKIFVLVDENTHRFCLAPFMAHIEEDHTATIIEIKAGEQHKNIKSCLHVWKALTENGADRKSLFIALGGGVVTDLGGFVASTYMRGITFINVPTSLLAMVDASVGGKTGVDLEGIKNLVGLINFPEMVIIDPSFLNTLPENHLKSGFTEMLKHGLIADEKYWEALSAIKELKSDGLDEHISTSVIIKNNIVMQDPEERHIRKVLNYGHTLGHAIESCFLHTSKQLLHGEAVAAGIILATYISHIMSAFPEKKLRYIKDVIGHHFNKIDFNSRNYGKIISLLKHDKKNTYGNINFVLLDDIGKPVPDQKVAKTLIMEAFEYYKK